MVRPITALVQIYPEEWLNPWRHMTLALFSHNHSVYVLDRATPCPWLAKIDGQMFPAKYLFTVDYTTEIVMIYCLQTSVLQLLDAGEWTGNIVALPNNRVRVTHPAWFAVGEGAPDFKPSQHIHYSKSDLDYTLDVNRVFDNLYNEDEK